MRNVSWTKFCFWEHPGKDKMESNGFPRWYLTGPRFFVLPLLGPEEGGRAAWSIRGFQRRVAQGLLFPSPCLIRLPIECFAFGMCDDYCLGFALKSLGARGSAENRQHHASGFPGAILRMFWWNLVLITITNQEVSFLIYLIMQLNTKWHH